MKSRICEDSVDGGTKPRTGPGRDCDCKVLSYKFDSEVIVIDQAEAVAECPKWFVVYSSSAGRDRKSLKDLPGLIRRLPIPRIHLLRIHIRHAPRGRRRREHILRLQVLL